jgi:MFS family permease
LRHRDFRWLLGGRFANFVGNAVAPVALAFAVLDLTGSVSDLGLVVGARSAANVALLLFGGVVADRLPRAVVLRGSALAAAMTQAVVAALVLTGAASIGLLMALSAVNGAVAAMAFPASAALTPQTVPPSLVRQANAVLRLAVNSATVGGAAVGGALVAAVGPGWGIAVDAATFAVSGFCFTMIRVPDVHRALEAATASTVARLREGWGEFVSRQWVWAVVLMAMAGNAAYTGGVVVLGPAVADASFGRRGWGLALAVGTIGMVVGGLLALQWQPRHALRWGTALGVTWALPLLALGASPSWATVAAAMFVSGVALEQFGIAWDVSLQQHVPHDRLARVYSYDAVGSFVAIPLGEVAVGPLAGRLGVEPTLVTCAAVVLVAVGAALCSPGVRSLTRVDVPGG